MERHLKLAQMMNARKLCESKRRASLTFEDIAAREAGLQGADLSAHIENGLEITLNAIFLGKALPVQGSIHAGLENKVCLRQAYKK